MAHKPDPKVQEAEAKEEELDACFKKLREDTERLNGRTKILKKKNGTRKSAKQRTG